jgi:nucleotide-binding universal stress UspA family protein
VSSGKKGSEFMKKHLLVTISDDLRLLHGVHFIASFLRNKSDVKVTLFYVSPRSEISSGGDKIQRQIDKKITEVYRQKGETALDVSQKYLCDRGFASQNISRKLMFKQFGTVKDIIRKAEAKLYDAVVLGKRGFAVFESILRDSVSKQILEKNIDFPLWICRQPEEGRRNVLLCVDGSEPCLRMADHVGFMLQHEKEHQITILHADTGEKKVKLITEAAKDKLLLNEVEAERINIRVTPSTGVVKTILREAAKGSYAVVAVGRAGAKKGLLQEWLVGSRSMGLLENLEKAVLWVSK